MCDQWSVMPIRWFCTLSITNIKVSRVIKIIQPKIQNGTHKVMKRKTIMERERWPTSTHVAILPHLSLRTPKSIMHSFFLQNIKCDFSQNFLKVSVCFFCKICFFKLYLSLYVCVFSLEFFCEIFFLFSTSLPSLFIGLVFISTFNPKTMHWRQ